MSVRIFSKRVKAKLNLCVCVYYVRLVCNAFIIINEIARDETHTQPRRSFYLYIFIHTRTTRNIVFFFLKCFHGNIKDQDLNGLSPHT